METKEKLLELYKEEYSKLKDEQISRIGFRDNLIYVTLAVMGSVFAFVLTNNESNHILLVIPWVSVVIGWTYIANDEKISSMGKYLNTIWKDNVLKELDGPDSTKGLLGWETYHKNDEFRMGRKTYQLAVDCLVFIAPGVLSLLLFSLFCSEKGTFGKGNVAIVFFELFLLIVLMFELYRHVDFLKKRE